MRCSSIPAIMCLILFAYQSHTQYPLIVAANRDEYYRRPALASHWWSTHPELLAGKDLSQGGTWLGITRQGQFAALTNVREATIQGKTYRSRGEIPLSYLGESPSPTSFTQQLSETAGHYRGYNLLFGGLDKLCYFSNRTTCLQEIPPGVHGLSNATLNTPWPKVSNGVAQLHQAIREPEPNVETIFGILESRAIAEDDQLPDTGIGIELERMLAPAFIQSPEYGTRSSLVLTIDKDNQVTFHEKQRAPVRSPLITHRFKIAL